MPDVARFGQQLLAGEPPALIPLPHQTTDPSFILFDLWAGRGAGWQALKTKPLAWAYKPEIVESLPAANEQQVEVVQANIEFSADVGVTNLLTRPPGKLIEDRVLRPTLTE